MILNLPKLCNNHKGLASWVRVQSHFAFWEHCRDVRYFLISQCGICLLGFPSIIISNHLLDVWQFTLQMLAVIPLIFIICRLKRGKKTGKFNKIKSYVLAAGKAEVNKKKKKGNRSHSIVGHVKWIYTKHRAVSQTRKAADSLCSIISSNLSFTKDTPISNNL